MYNRREHTIIRFFYNVVKAVNFHVMFNYFTRVKTWISTHLKNWKLDFCPSFTSSFTSLFTYINIYIAFYSKTWFLSIIYINIYLHHYLHCILQQNLSFKLTWFFTLISYCNSRCLFTSIFTSKFTYNPKIINRKNRCLLKRHNSFTICTFEIRNLSIRQHFKFLKRLKKLWVSKAGHWLTTACWLFDKPRGKCYRFLHEIDPGQSIDIRTVSS